MKRLLHLFFAVCIVTTAHAQFSGSGSGTESDPYLIFNPIQLDQVRNFLEESVYFKMMADIDLTQFIQDNYPTEGWLPIGNSSSSFQGNFDGNGHKITNMTINRPTANDLGLFGYISAATIQNVSVQGTIQGNNNLGGLAGCIYNKPSTKNLNTTISNVKTEVTISGNNYLGGIIGYINDYCYNNYPYYYSTTTIKNIESNVSLDGKENLGGIVGYITNTGYSSYISYCTLQKAIVDCQIKGEKYCGGVVGYYYNNNYAYSNLYYNYVDGLILANEYIGGICGYGYGDRYRSHSSDLHNNYFVGTLIGKQYVGGVCGYIENYVKIYNNYSNATISGTTEVGGIVGYLNNYCEAKSNVAINDIVSGTSNVGRIYGNKGTSSVTIGTIGTATTNKALTTTKVIVNNVEQTVTDTEQHGQSAGQAILQYKATYQGIGWNFSSIWDMQETETLPYLAFQSAPPTIDPATTVSGSTTLSGKGTAGATIYLSVNGKPYTTLCSESNVWQIAVDPLVAGADISAYAIATDKSRSYTTHAKVSYLGSGTESDPYRIYNQDELSRMNGKGYYILMNDIDLSGTAEWKPIAQNSTISAVFDGQNYTISGLTITTAVEQAALFAACSDMTIKNLNLNVKKINGSGITATLVAKAIDTNIENCHVIITGNVKGTAEVGGLVGSALNTNIANCSVQGIVQGGTKVGGAVGAITGSITKVSVDGTVMSTTSNAKVGGIVGYNEAPISECMSSGKVACTASGSYVGGLIGENTNVAVSDCYSTTAVTANQYAGGLIAYNYGAVTNCYACGNITSTNNAGGVIGYNDGTNATLAYCCAMNKEIKVSSASGIAIRVIGGIKNSAPLPENNYALKTMAVSVNGIEQTIYDDPLNGTAQTEDELKQEIFYMLMGWDMVDVWGINEGAEYPYLHAFSNIPVEHSLHLSDSNTSFKAGTYEDGLDYTREVGIDDEYADFCLPFDVTVEGNITIVEELYVPLGLAFQYKDANNKDVVKVFFVSTPSVEAGLPFIAKLVNGHETTLKLRATTNSINDSLASSYTSILPYEYNPNELGSQAAMPTTGNIAFIGALNSKEQTDAYELQPDGEYIYNGVITVNPFYTCLTLDNPLLAGAAKVVAFIDDSDNVSTEIESILNSTNNEINVYTLDGRCIMQGVSKEDALHTLQNGVFILGNQKVMLK